MTHWLLVSSESHFETSRQRGFDVAGMKSRWRKAATDVRAGDTVFFYITRLKAIAGEALVIGEAFEDHTPIWKTIPPTEFYPHRFPIDMVKARDRGHYLPVEAFISQYAYAKKWPYKNWTLAFQGNVHRLGDKDYRLIHDLL
jgi:hypothetical protein